MKKIVIALVILVVAVGVYFVITTGDDTSPAAEDGEETSVRDVRDEDVVAVVNGEEITGEEYNDLEANVATQQGIIPETLSGEAQAELQTQILDALISQELLEQAVATSDINVTDERIEQEIALIREQFDTDEAYQEALAAQDLTPAELRQQIRTDIETQLYLEEQLDVQNVTATDAEVRAEYEESIQGSEQVPPFDQVEGQVEQMVIQEKQQEIVQTFLDERRAEADVEILI